MAKIVIIGAGFAGVSLIKNIFARDKGHDVTLIDQSSSSIFLPLLPDVLGRKIGPSYLEYDLRRLGSKINFKFVEDRVLKVEIAEKRVFTLRRTLDYDYLAVASGSETNFYGNDSIKKVVFKLDNIFDAKAALKAVEEGGYDRFVVIGGGYTGIEIATNLRKIIKEKSILIVERAPSILGPLPQWMKEYVSDNLRFLNIECLNG
ncbi:MAG: FAD-dependent oxidoreductase, partial [Candidatus Omnitrophica bacterium]|nr:FAD-dependent oxidoreductase [Candidatus Omnitrophota bacterium]